VLTRSGEPVRKKMTDTPEPKDKLDAATTVAANGPEDDMLGWRQIDWRAAEASVRRLRQRIFTASQAASARLRACGACLSRMLGNGHVRF
jgi:hypothetical protein